jgi:ribonuclease P/MRP protein subunit RPP40
LKTINAGVPQGSILGPLLFLLYINDIVDEIGTDIRLYADDSTLVGVSDNQHDNTTQLNENLSKINDWAKKWFITFNPSKTISLLFSKTEPTHIEPLYMNGTQINEVKSHKHLGCTLQQNLKWKVHINDICSKCSRRVDILRGLKHTLDRKTLEILYTAFIRPILEYASTVWTNCTIEQQTEIEKIQLAPLRVITGAIKGTSHEIIYKESYHITTYEKRNRNNLIMFYKIYHGITPNYLHDILPPTILRRTNYPLRNSNNISLIPCHTTLFQNSFFPSTIKKWNELNDTTRYIGSLDDFKHHLSKHDRKPPSLYYHGDRHIQLTMARLRMRCSQLKKHLFDMHIIDDSSCECGSDTEDTYHYFFTCPLYTAQRAIFQNLTRTIEKSCSSFLYGDKKATLTQNHFLMGVVTQYINKTKRFT